MIDYGERWFLAKHRLIKPFDQEVARARHEKLEHYCAVLFEDGERRVINVVPPWYSVWFFDVRNRKYLTYKFKQIDTKLFLDTIMHWKFDCSGETVSQTKLRFTTNGQLLVEELDRAEDSMISRTGEISVDTNWESIPNFGCYERLMVKERGPLPEAQNGIG